MPVYAYAKPSLVDEIAVVKTDGGASRAYLHASDNATPKQLYDIACKLAEKNWQCVPFTRNGKPVLEVRGFSRDGQLIDQLKANQWIEGTPTVTREQEKPSSFVSKVKSRSLLASSLAYMIGDICFAKYGYEESSKLDLAAGILYGAGTVSSLAFGRKDQSDLQIKALSKKMSEYIRKEGVSLPQECTLDAIIEDKHKNVAQKADDFLRQYPSELLNLFFAAAGVCIAAAAYKEKVRIPASAETIAGRMEKLLAESSKHADAAHAAGGFDKLAVKLANKDRKAEGWMDVGLGSMTVVSGLLAASMKEKVPDPDAPPKHGLAAVKEFVQQKPLAIAGIGYLISTACHAVSTTIAWKSGDVQRVKSVPWRAGFIGANIVAELLLAMSSKGHGHGVVSDKSVDDTVVALASELIAKQPRRLQPILTDHVADFLGRPEILAKKDKDLRDNITRQVEAMRQNPWAMAEREADKEAGRTSVTVPDMPKSWQGKVVVPEVASRGSAMLGA